MTHLSLSQPTRIQRRSTNEARSLLVELNRPLLPKSETAHLLTSIRANDTLTILRCNIYHTNLYDVATTLHNLQRPNTIKDTVHKNIRYSAPLALVRVYAAQERCTGDSSGMGVRLKNSGKCSQHDRFGTP